MHDGPDDVDALLNSPSWLFCAGVNNNAYQISRGLQLNERIGHGVSDRCSFVKADFMNMPVQAGSYGECWTEHHTYA